MQRINSGKNVFASKREQIKLRQQKASERASAREDRTNEEQIALVLARGGKPDCKEIRRLSDVK